MLVRGGAGGGGRAGHSLNVAVWSPQQLQQWGGRGRTTGWDWLIVPAPGAGWILASVSSASMVKRTNGARGVGGGASLMGVSVSPAVLTLGGSGGGEGKFDLAFLREDDDPGSEGRNVLGVDGDNHRSGLLSLSRISARVKVPG